MPVCTCGSHNVQSNHVSDEAMKRVLHVGHAAHRAGFHLGGALSLAAVGGIKLVNGQRKAWRCNNCGNRFND